MFSEKLSIDAGPEAGDTLLMKRMTWIPVFVGALLLVIALPIFADDIARIGAQDDLQAKIESANWNSGSASTAAPEHSIDPSYPGAGCEFGRDPMPF